jgi:hypothetical protein
MEVLLALGWAYSLRGGTKGDEPCVKVDSESWLDCEVADVVRGRAATAALAASEVSVMGELKGLLGESMVEAGRVVARKRQVVCTSTARARRVSPQSYVSMLFWP